MLQHIDLHLKSMKVGGFRLFEGGEEVEAMLETEWVVGGVVDGGRQGERRRKTGEENMWGDEEGRASKSRKDGEWKEPRKY